MEQSLSAFTKSGAQLIYQTEMTCGQRRCSEVPRFLLVVTKSERQGSEMDWSGGLASMKKEIKTLNEQTKKEIHTLSADVQAMKTQMDALSKDVKDVHAMNATLISKIDDLLKKG